jgi:hypothetical protein
MIQSTQIHKVSEATLYMTDYPGLHFVQVKDAYGYSNTHKIMVIK